MEETQKQLKVWRIVAIAAICLCLVTVFLYAGEKISFNTNGGVTLSYWTKDSTARVFLEEYMKAITDKNSKDFIPVEDRIAVFDMDGTLCCETDPGYFDHMLYYHRVMEDPDYKDKATQTEKDVAAKCKEYFDSRSYPEELSIEHGQGVASAFAGMTQEEFTAYVKNYRNTPTNSYEGMTMGEAFYRPMVQIIDYLNANDFTVYIVSGTDRLIMRGLLEDNMINVPMDHIIGSDEALVASNQGDTDGLEYQFTDDDKVILAGEFIVKNLKMNKVSVIAQEIGKQPVLSFGNSSGDKSMCKYTTTNNQYRSQAFLLCCDDMERENGKQDAADKMAATCEENNWIAVSMKNDWTTIYGDGVTKKA